MRRYNIQDVRLLEEAYEYLRPWMTNHPHHGLYSDQDEVCPNCGSAALQRRGYAMTAVGKFQRFVCNDCGSWTRAVRRDYAVSNTQIK